MAATPQIWQEIKRREMAADQGPRAPLFLWAVTAPGAGRPGLEDTLAALGGEIISQGNAGGFQVQVPAMNALQFCLWPGLARVALAGEEPQAPAPSAKGRPGRLLLVLGGLLLLAGGLFLAMRPAPAPRPPLAAPVQTTPPIAQPKAKLAAPAPKPAAQTQPAQSKPVLSRPAQAQPAFGNVDHFLAGLEAYQAKNWELAAEHWRVFVAQNPKRLGVRRALAVVLLKLGKKDEARAQYRAILAKQPRDAQAKAALAKLDQQKP